MKVKNLCILQQMTSVGEDVGEMELKCRWNGTLVQPLWKAAWRFIKKLKAALPYEPAISLLDVYPKKTKTLIQKGICIPTFIAALFAISKMEATETSTNR